MNDAGAAAPELRAHALDICVGRRALLASLDLRLNSGRFLAVLGRNGTGKTLTLQTLAGLRPRRKGELLLAGHDLATLPRAEVARSIGYLAQDPEGSFPMTVLESVLIGRHPHLPAWRWESERDRRIARESLAAVGLEGLEERDTDTLSGGEQRRVAIAALLAQAPRIFLLDEPTNHLDPQHQSAVLALFRARAEAGASVVATLHDPNLAARHAHEVLLLHGDGRWEWGQAPELLTSERLSALYRAPIVEGLVGGRRTFVTGD